MNTMIKNARYAYNVLVFLIVAFALCACANSGKQNESSIAPSDLPTRSESQTASTNAPPQNEPPIISNDASPIETEQPKSNEAADIDEPTTLNAVSGEVTISFDYEKQSGYASNQFAVWIEDTDGKYIKTLYATRYTASGGYKDRPDSIALWVKKSNLASMKKSEVDAITSAMPSTGNLSYVWDLTGTYNEKVSPGEYKFFVEGTLRWKNYVLYSGVIAISDNPATVQTDAKFVYEASDGQAALTSDSPENNMIGAVTASFAPTAD